MSLVRVDCHLHTVASGDAVTTLDELAERAAQAGLDVVCITDHNETSAAVTAAGRNLGVRIIVGEEIRTPDGDIIGLFLTERVPYVLPVPKSSPGSGRKAAWCTRRTRSTRTAPAWAGCCRACARPAPWTSSRSSTLRPQRRDRTSGPLPSRRPTPSRAGPARTRTIRPASARRTWRCPTSTARPASWLRWRTRR